MNNRAKMEESIRTLYGKVFNAGQADLLPGLIAGPYIQHNPLFPNGPEPLIGYLKQTGSLPCEVKRVAIDGNLAFVQQLIAADRAIAGLSCARLGAGHVECAAADSRVMPLRITNKVLAAV